MYIIRIRELPCKPLQLPTPHRFFLQELLEQSQLPVSELSAIYSMSDRDGDGLLSEGEFVCAMALVARRRRGLPLTEEVPLELQKACWAAKWGPKVEELKRRRWST